MKFSDFICFKAVVPELKAIGRNEAIKELVSSLCRAGAIPAGDSARLSKAVIKRENQASTGMGWGVAVPHVKHPAVKKAVATIGRSSHGIDFASLDKKPVHSIVLLLSPSTEPDRHLEAMKQIFSQLRDETFRRFLRQAETAVQIEELFREADESPLMA